MLALLGLTIGPPAATCAPLDPDQPTQTRASEADQGRVRAVLENLPLHFIENRGQVDGRVAYYVSGRDTSVYFTNEGVTFALTNPAARRASLAAAVPAASLSPAPWLSALEPAATQTRWAVKLDFLNANPRVRLKGQDPTPAVISYFTGRPDQWKTGLATYTTLVYEELWPGIDLVYSGRVNRLKYQFVVKPGADPQRIKLAYRGATAVQLNPAGQLAVSTPVGSFHDDKPYAYQEVAGRRVAVATAYALEAKASSAMLSWPR